jgi:hypothetical protein
MSTEKTKKGINSLEVLMYGSDQSRERFQLMKNREQGKDFQKKIK